MRHDQSIHRRDFLKTTAGAAAGFSIVPFAIGLNGAEQPEASRISYCCDGRIYVNEPGAPEGKPLTTGHMDFKPSWSKTEGRLICFRRTKNDPITANWKSAIFVVNADGSGFHLLSDGTRTDFNPTWTRDGSNAPIWNRKNDKTGAYCVMKSKVGGKPGDEIPLTDTKFHTWAHSCLTDGRILVNSRHPTLGFGVCLLTCKEGESPCYEPVQCELSAKGELHRASISPSEKKICFEFMTGHKFSELGHVLYIADFDAEKRTITNLKVIANAEANPKWYAYARWINGESAVVYHLNQTGKGELQVYQLSDGTTKRVSTNPKADYRYPHGEAAPC